MTKEKGTRAYSDGTGDATYLDVQAAVGISKHPGGYAATDRLHELCHMADANEVLDVGCGIGVSPVYIAKRFKCRIVALDLSEKMLAWSRQRARRAGLTGRITFQQGDVRELPFEENRFDVTIVESVLAFVEDKDTALRELIRVTRPGGYVGINENCWLQLPRPEWLERALALGTAILTEEQWRALWGALPLQERIVEIHPQDTRQEVRDRIGWVGWRSILPAWGRVIRLMVTNPSAREMMKEQLDTPTELLNHMAFALLAGRKPGE